MQLGEILKTAHQHDASDIHIISGHPPMMRVHTVMTPMDSPILTPEAVAAALEEMTLTASLPGYSVIPYRARMFSWTSFASYTATSTSA